MKWFEGSVADAISSAQQKRCLFIVFAADEQPASVSTQESWDSDAVGSVASSSVALKVTPGSDSYTQFTQIYPVTIVPTSYMISPLSGGPLEVVQGTASTDELLAKLQSAQEKLTSAGSAMAANTAGAAPAQASAAATAPAPQTASGAAASTTPAAQQPSNEDKIAKARELIAMKRQQRQEEEKQKDLDSELSRRESGKKLQEYKAQQKSREASDRRKEMQREKDEADRAREEIRRKIAEDKAARRQKQSGSAAASASSEPVSATAAAAAAPSVARPPSLPSDMARIQFRFPDGSSLTEDFSSTTQLSVARQFVADRVSDRFPNGFSLCTTYPRQELTFEVDDQTLQELQLSPRSAVLVLPKTTGKQRRGGSGAGAATALSPDSGVWKIIMIPLLLLQAIWQWLTGSAASSSSPSTPAPSGSQAASQPMPQASSSGDAAEARQRRGRGPETGSSFGVSKEGRVNRFKPNDGGDEDDDMGTWNGNSTQQQ
ncbi:UBX domain-containing protein 4-like [Sycon ciliatum]|uniref:UBX domain-containing protein 4-like n=1 Tax=Sycon ciliatum TaxID=27933 RepID=UPI0031F6EC72